MKKGSKYTPEQKARVDAAAQKRGARMSAEQRAASSRRLRKGIYKSRPTLGERIVRFILQISDVPYDWQKRVSVDGRDHYADIFVEPNVLVEIDGEWWHGYASSEPYMVHGKTSEQRRKETEQRNADYLQAGYKVICFLERDLKRDMPACVKKLLEGVGAPIPDSLKEATYAELAEDAKQHLHQMERQQRKERYERIKDRENERRRDKRAGDVQWRDAENQRRRERRDDHAWRDAENARIRERYAQDPDRREHIRAYNKKSHEKHRAKRLAANKARYAKNKDEVLAGQKDYYYANREEIRARQNAKWASDHEWRDAQNKKRRDEYHKDPSKIQARNKKSYEKHREKRIAEDKNRTRGAKASLVGILGGECWCGKPGKFVRTNMEACRKAGHVRLNGPRMRWYVDNPAEAREFLFLVCEDHEHHYRGRPRVG